VAQTRSTLPWAADDSAVAVGAARACGAPTPNSAPATAADVATMAKNDRTDVLRRIVERYDTKFSK
jgi:hypothetical protein